MIYIYILLSYIYIWIWWVVYIAKLICNDLSFEFGRIRKVCFKCPNYTYIYIYPVVWVWKWRIYHPQKSKYQLFTGKIMLILQWNFPVCSLWNLHFAKFVFFFYIHGHIVNPLPSSPPHAAMPPFGMVYNPRRWISSVQFQPNLEGNRCQHVDFTILRNLDCGN